MNKLRVQIGERTAVLRLDGEPAQPSYELSGDLEAAGTASIEQVQENVFSVLLNGQSRTVYIVPVSGGFSASVRNQSFAIEISDLRDRSAGLKKQAHGGASELRALMPGKVVKLLVAAGERVEAGQSLVVVEAMKMQNELKAPRAGAVSKIYVSEGVAVAAGERLLVVE